MGGRRWRRWPKSKRLKIETEMPQRRESPAECWQLCMFWQWHTVLWTSVMARSMSFKLADLWQDRGYRNTNKIQHHNPYGTNNHNSNQTKQYTWHLHHQQTIPHLTMPHNTRTRRPPCNIYPLISTSTPSKTYTQKNSPMATCRHRHTQARRTIVHSIIHPNIHHW